MASERRRILELALESLENRKKQIEDEIAALTGELRQSGSSKPARATRVTVSATKPVRRRSRFTKEERARRAARMKAYWDKWRKDKAKQK